MSSKLRFWNRLLRFKVSYWKPAPIIYLRRPCKTYKDMVIPCTLGFSIFTWLGFSAPLNAEDELIQTIKHCILFIQKTEYDKAEQLLHIALRQAQQIQHQLGVTYIYDVMANLALQRDQLDKAKPLFVAVSQRIIADGATEDDPRLVHLSVKLARISHLKKEYTTAQLGFEWCLEKLNKILSEKPTDDMKKLLAMAEDWYGRLFLDCNQHEQGLKLMVSSLEKMREIPNIEQEHIVVQLNDIGTICNELGRIDECIDYLTEAIEIGKPLEMDDLGTMYVNLGRSYIKKSLLLEARKSCGQAWKLGVLKQNKNIKYEAELCLTEIKRLS